MRNIYAIGETVLDIIFKNGKPQTAKPGGAMLNSIVSLGRIGLPVHFISEYADDEVGSLIDSFLHENGVDTNYVYHFRDGKTKLALAFLNERNDAAYTFYEKYPQTRLETLFPRVSNDDIVLFGSIYAITNDIRIKLRNFIEMAHSGGALIIYDPNFRGSHMLELDQLKPMIIENMKMAGIIRGSDEDFRNLFGAGNADEAWEVVMQYCSCLVYTASSEGVYVRTPAFRSSFPVRKIKPVSTIGAGDNFNAGMMAALHINNISREQLEKMGGDQWTEIVTMGVDFASEVCMSYDNYISTAFAGKMLRKTRKTTVK